MRVLYRNPENQSLSVTETSNTRYLEEEGILLFLGADDVCVPADRKTADKLVKSLYLEGRVDISMYECAFCELSEEDDEEEVMEDSILDGSPFLIDF